MGATARKLDFTGVSEGSDFRPKRKEEGDYLARIVKVDDFTSKAGNDGWVFTIKIDGDTRAAYPYYVGTDDDKQLWKVRQLFVAAGLAVPSKRVNADPNRVVGKAIGVALEDDEYEGRPKSTIAAVFPVADVEDPMNGDAVKTKSKSKAAAPADDDDDDDEDDEPAPVKTKAKAKPAKKAPVVEDDDDDDDDDEPPAKPVKKAAKGKAKPVVEDDDEDDDDDDDDAPPPPKKSKAKPAPAKGKKAKPAADDDDDDLDLDDL